jgi:hypothetical protein
MKYKLIPDQDEFEVFLKRFHFVEDALIKMVSIQNSSYVASDHGMFGFGNDRFTVRILFQTQWEYIPALEILCEEVDQFAIENNREIGLHGQVGLNSFTLFFDDRKIMSNGMRGRTIKYRQLEESFLGKDSCLDKFIPEDSELFAELQKHKQHQNIRWLALWIEDKGGVFVFQFEDVTKPCLYDQWFESLDEAFQWCNKQYNIQRNDWMTRENLGKKGIVPYRIHTLLE